MKKVVNVEMKYTENEVKITFTSLYEEIILVSFPLGKGLLYPGGIALRELEEQLALLKNTISRAMAKALVNNIFLANQEWLEIKGNQLCVCSTQWWEYYPLSEIR